MLEVDEGGRVLDTVVLGSHFVGDLDDVDSLGVQFVVDVLQFLQDHCVVGFVTVVCRNKMW